MKAPVQLMVLGLLAAPPEAQAQLAVPDPVRRMYVPLSPTESLHVAMAGRGAPVVLIPGLFGSIFGYRHLLTLLPAAGYRAIVVEPLGIGTSARPEKGNYSLTHQADRIASVLQRLSAEPAVVVAHSTSASMALRMAYRHPALVKAVVSVDGGPAETAASPGFRRAMRYVPWIKWLGGVRRVRGKIRDNLIDTSVDTTWVTEDVVDGYTAGARADLDGTLKAYLRMAETREPERLLPHLKEVRCPVRLVVGQAPHPGGIPADQLADLRGGLPILAIDSIPEVGLHVHEERPAAIVEAVRKASEEAESLSGNET